MLAVGDIVVTPTGRSAKPASTAEPQVEHAEHVLAWHFVGHTLRDGSAIPPDGVVLRHDGSLVMCESGLHASERPVDALQYAPGETLCRVRCGGQLVHDTDKLICTERTILWRIDASELLREFARRCALDVAHLWAAPEVVLDYLRTGDETKMDAAKAAAWGAACDAAWGTAWAAWAAVLAADRDTAWAAAGAAAKAAANAARDAARAAQNKRLTEMIALTAETHGFSMEAA